MLFQSQGVLSYSELNDNPSLRLIIDEDIVRYYRSFIPKFIRIKPQMYRAHISVVRNNFPANIQYWHRYEGEIVDFYYENEIKNCTKYFWIDCYSVRLEEVRQQLGLEIYNMDRELLTPFKMRFHTTIGNLK
jgi:hypothetical protein